MFENTMNVALRRLGYAKDEATSHGFRASAATLLNEAGMWNADAIERLSVVKIFETGSLVT
jgi:integrase